MTIDAAFGDVAPCGVRGISLTLTLALVAACAAGDDFGGAGGGVDAHGGGGPDDAGGGAATSPDFGPPIDAGPLPLIASVYAHTAEDLYAVDPDTLAITFVGAFDCGDNITDIAVDADGGMVGVSLSSVFRIDPSSAACTYLAEADGSYNGLSYIPVGGIDADAEVLVATSFEGALYEVDPATGGSTLIG